MSEEAKRRVHEAIQSWLDEGEIAICWTLTIDVAGPEDTRYLAHRAGGGFDGTENPMTWTALGMLEASVGVAREQLSVSTEEPPEDDDD